MSYKLVCIDMDGTLLNSNKKVTEETKRTLLEAKKRGVMVAISTGRIYNNAAFYSKYIGLNSPVIAANGAIVKSEAGDELYKGIIGYETSLEVLGILKKYNMKANFHTHNSIYCGGLLEKLFIYFFITRGIPADYKVNLYSIKSSQWEKILFDNQSEILKCISIHTNKKVVQRAKEELRNIKGIEISSSNSFNIEVNAKGVCKGKGVEILGEKFGIKKEEIICIGDNENDLSMIEYAGLGVAMGNAPEYIKNKADYITSTNNEEGVSKVIKKFILKENII